MVVNWAMDIKPSVKILNRFSNPKQLSKGIVLIRMKNSLCLKINEERRISSSSKFTISSTSRFQTAGHLDYVTLRAALTYL